ncbi:MAG TPA: TonB-dependent receptor [Gemmatimonadaceae bacterium]
MSGNRIRMLFVLAMMAVAAPLQAQTATLTGKITNREGKPVPNAIIEALSGTTVVAADTADAEGAYRLTVPRVGNYQVTVRGLGYARISRPNLSIGTGGSSELNFQLESSVMQLDAVVTAASRAPEKVLDAPASVQVVNTEAVQSRAAVNIADHVASLPGIDVARGGIARSNVVARGFNNIFSGALMTLTDNRFAFVPSLRVNIPYLSPTAQEDIDHIEVVLGPGAALYGPNTASGVMAVTTRSPFERTSVNPDAKGETTITLDGGNQDYMRGAVRTAWALSNKLAVKGTFDIMSATEWSFPKADSIGNPADPSDDEKKPRDPDIRRYGGEARIDFRPTPGSEFIANYGRSKAGSAVEPTGLGPAQVKDWVYQTFQLRGRVGRLFAQAFMNTSDAGETYLLQKIAPTTQCPNASDQACIIDKSRQFAAQIQHGFNLANDRERILYGLDYINTQPRTEGTINGSNEDDDDITEVGGYIHSVTKLTDMFELTAAARVDKHSRLEDPVFSPRVALVFKPTENNSLRLTYNRAFSTPSTNNLFLDLVATKTPILNIKALGTPETGLSFRRDCTGGLGDLCMKVFPAFNGTGSFVPANPYAASFAAAKAGIVAALTAQFTAQFTQQGVPNAAAAAAQAANGIATFLGSRTPTAAQVGTTLLVPPVGGAAGFVVQPDQLFDIDRPKPTIHEVVEGGYKGIIGDRLQLSVDVWHEKRTNFVGPLQLETPLVFLNGQVLGQYFGQQLATFLPQIGLPAAAAPTIAGALATALPGSNPTISCSTATPAGCPIGVVNFDTPAAGSDVIVAYRSYSKPIKLWGSDVGAQLALPMGFSVAGTYSWVNKGIFKKEDLGTRDDVSLNAPRNKHSVTVRYSNDDSGWGAELRERHVDAFNTLAFVGGPVEAYTLVDAGVHYRPAFWRNAMLAINGTNILNEVHREFTLGSNIGRLIITRLQVTF